GSDQERVRMWTGFPGRSAGAPHRGAPVLRVVTKTWACSGRKGVSAVVQGVDESVLDQGVQSAFTLDVVVPDHVQGGLGDRVLGVAQDGEQATTYLSVGSRIRLCTARWAVVGGFARQFPGTLVRD